MGPTHYLSTMEKFRRGLRDCLIFAAIVLYVYGLWAMYKMVVVASRKKEYCGVVMYKTSHLSSGKYPRTEDIMIVDFENGVGRHEMRPGLLTFAESKVGDHICFTLPTRRLEKTFNSFIPEFIGILASIITGIGLIGGLAFVVCWAFDWRL